MLFDLLVFGEAMENDFQLALRRFCQTIWQLRKGICSLFQAVFGTGKELLIQTENFVEWKEHSKDLLNSPFISTFEESETEYS